MINTITYGLDTYGQAARTYGSARDSGDVAKEQKSSEAGSSADRTARDTIEISEEGQKIINLGRGGELAAALPDARADRAAFDAALERAQEDIKRITTLFGGVLSPANGLAEFLLEKAEERQGTSSSTSEEEFAKALSAAFNDIRRVTDEVDLTLQEKAANVGA